MMLEIRPRGLGFFVEPVPRQRLLGGGMNPQISPFD
jgi:hypothetical protein